MNLSVPKTVPHEYLQLDNLQPFINFNKTKTVPRLSLSQEWYDCVDDSRTVHKQLWEDAKPLLRSYMNDDVFNKMAARWPSSIVARAEVKNFTGGGISPKTIANADSEGKGPTTRLVIGRRVCYPVSDLIDWLRKNAR